MSRKSFIIWGLLIIQLSVTGVAVTQYLTFSKVIDIRELGAFLPVGQLLLPAIAVGIILHFRFKKIGHRKRTLALCMFLYLYSITMPNIPATLYSDYVIMGSDIQTRFHQAIGEWAKLDDPKSGTPWTAIQKIEYICLMLPPSYLAHWNIAALLWFGSLDPRKPSKNRVVQFFKTGFQRKSRSAVQTNLTEVAHG